jgi:hypothetical protein
MVEQVVYLLGEKNMSSKEVLMVEMEGKVEMFTLG